MCTFLTFPDAQGNAYKGRTMELTRLDSESIVYYPAGSAFKSRNPRGEVTFDFQTRHPFVCLEMVNQFGFEYSPLLEGANDQGLTVSVNALRGASRSVVPDADMHRALSLFEFGHYALGNCTTLAEVRDLLEHRAFLYVPEKLKDLLQLHYAFMDRSGRSIVVEYMNEAVQIYDNPVGVMTNAPAFPWHLENLNNYTHLSPLNKNEARFGALQAAAPDAGIAMAGVPASQISSGRFVKAAFYKTWVTPGTTPDAHIVQLAHIMNNFDRPAGLTRNPATAGDGADPEGGSGSEVTEWTMLFDAARSRLYFRSCEQLNFTLIDLPLLARSSRMQAIPYAQFTGFDLHAA